MHVYYITFRSVTHAQQAERSLKNRGIPCTLLRTPRWMEEQGCGYSLKLWTKDPREALGILREQGSRMRRVYLKLPSGQLEEVSL